MICRYTYTSNNARSKERNPNDVEMQYEVYIWQLNRTIAFSIKLISLIKAVHTTIIYTPKIWLD